MTLFSRMKSRLRGLAICQAAFAGMLLTGCTSTPAQADPPAELTSAPAGTFSIVVIPDTQRYLGKATKSTPESDKPVSNIVFNNHTRWIADNVDGQNIVFVSHVGDIVDRNNHEQWKVARECMDRLHGLVPYGISVGNHDMTSGGDSTLFQEYFPRSRFEDFAWYGGCFEPDRPETTISGNNANSYQLFSAGGKDFVFLHLECNAPDDVLAWADSVLEEHADRKAIITTHMGLGPIEKPESHEGFVNDPKGRMQWIKIHGSRGNTPQQMWDKCFSQHKNVFMVCNGDQSRTTAMYQKSTGVNGNTIHEFLSDYTSSGPLRIYRFHPQQNELEVITYDTSKAKLCLDHQYVPGWENHQFKVSLD
ncbi:metallophosphoesterase [Rubinisphaera sp. JC750]|uniref:metallophosphoesterase n=1 Tax=Rubinisphaera sp. JC750 TaxID=2898658 RepID=UPI001F41847A|nr:metallophosphoesterase [Rubinisphaera sp. JC750]